jgi:hypothetical protein
MEVGKLKGLVTLETETTRILRVEKSEVLQRLAGKQKANDDAIITMNHKC